MLALFLVFASSGMLVTLAARRYAPPGIGFAVVPAFVTFVLGWRLARARREPDLATESRNAVVGVAAGLAWLIAAILAVRLQIRWFPQMSALMFYALGTAGATLAGAAGAAAFVAARRPSFRFLPVVVALVVPPVAAAAVPSFGPLRTTPLPGRGDYAVTARPDGTANLYVIRNGGTEIEKLTDTGTATGGADLSADGSRVAFGDERRGTVDLWVMDLDASMRATGLTRVTHASGDETFPEWSPDGRAIVYTEWRHGRADVRVLDLATGAMTPITRDGDSWGPSWSPDGSSILYSSGRGKSSTNYDIWRVGANGEDPHAILDSGGDDWDPHASPDGRRLLFSSDAAGDDDVWLARIDGRRARPLTLGEPAADHAFGWSPTGRFALFLSDRSEAGGDFLFFMPVGGGPATLGVVL
jgi:Tol biopolymer transport system component